MRGKPSTIITNVNYALSISPVHYGPNGDTRHIIPAMLPPVSPQGTTELVSKDLDGFVGKYESKPDKDVLTIFADGNELYLRGRDADRAKLFPETENRFVGTVMDIVDFQIVFIKDERGEVEHLTLESAVFQKMPPNKRIHLTP